MISIHKGCHFMYEFYPTKDSLNIIHQYTRFKQTQDGYYQVPVIACLDDNFPYENRQLFLNKLICSRSDFGTAGDRYGFLCSAYVDGIFYVRQSDVNTPQLEEAMTRILCAMKIEVSPIKPIPTEA